MECNRCHAKIEPGDEKQHLGQTLCEDCYMDALSPVKTCDPWAVHSAKSFEKYAESALTLTPIQSEITSKSLFYTACRLKPCPSILKVMICPAYGKRPQISNCIFRLHPLQGLTRHLQKGGVEEPGNLVVPTGALK